MNQQWSITNLISYLAFFEIVLILLPKLYVAFTKQVNFSDLRSAISKKKRQIS